MQAVVDEIAPILANRSLGKIFQIAKQQLVIDFRPGDGRYLFLNFEAHTAPRMYLVRRRVRDLEKQSQHTGNFVQFARKKLADAQLVKLEKDPTDRVVRFRFLAEDETNGSVDKLTVVAQFTGRTANLFLLDANNRILDSLRETNDDGKIYAPPSLENEPRQIEFQAAKSSADKESLLAKISEIALPPADFEFVPASPLSAKLDAYFSRIESTRDFDQIANSARGRIKQDLNKKEKLLSKLEHDLTKHGDAETLKKTGDLLLANLYTARRENGKTVVIDYFNEAAEIALDVDENQSLTEAAESFFARYAKARNANLQLTERIENLKSEISNLQSKQNEIEQVIATGDEAALLEFVEVNNLSAKSKAFDEPANKPKKKQPEAPSGTRRYRSSDGLEILVGRTSKDNDYLTVRVAKSLDWWLHAADYPGSHVVVRNPSKGELPTKTLLEAAQLAAKFSQAREDTKVAVNYTQRKFVTKPKNAHVGAVRLASFRTILVEPKEAGTRIL